MNYLKSRGRSIEESFKIFHAKNPHVYREFESQAMKAVWQGKKRISAKMIINYLRWSEYLKTKSDDYKINDIYSCHYARMFVKNNPKHKDIFEFRKLRS